MSLGKSNYHNPINYQALLVNDKLKRTITFNKRSISNANCPINNYATVFNTFYQNSEFEVHGCSFDNNNNVYMLCTYSNLFLKGYLNSDGEIENVITLTPESSQELMRQPVGCSFDSSFSYIYSTNFLAIVPGKPTLSLIVRTNTSTGETQSLYTPQANLLIIGPNGALVTEPPDTNNMVLYVCSFGTSQIIKIVFDNSTNPPTEV